MSFIKKEELIEAIKDCGLPYDKIAIYRIIELVNSQLVYHITFGEK